MLYTPVRSSRDRENVFRSNITGMGGSASFKYTPMHGQTYVAPFCLPVYRLEHDKNKTCSIRKLLNQAIKYQPHPSQFSPHPTLLCLENEASGRVSNHRQAIYDYPRYPRTVLQMSNHMARGASVLAHENRQPGFKRGNDEEGAAAGDVGTIVWQRREDGSPNALSRRRRRDEATAGEAEGGGQRSRGLVFSTDDR